MLILKHAIPAMIKKSVDRKTKPHKRKVKVSSSYKQPYFNILEVLVLLKVFFFGNSHSDHNFGNSYYLLPVI